MSDTMLSVRMLISAQMLATVFLAVLLWALHVQLRRQEFNRWWTCAWVMTALFFSVGRLAMAVPPAWAITKGTLILLATLFGYLVAPALVVRRDQSRVARPYHPTRCLRLVCERRCVRRSQFRNVVALVW